MVAAVTIERPSGSGDADSKGCYGVNAQEPDCLAGKPSAASLGRADPALARCARSRAVGDRATNISDPRSVGQCNRPVLHRPGGAPLVPLLLGSGAAGGSPETQQDPGGALSKERWFGSAR